MIELGQIAHILALHSTDVRATSILSELVAFCSTYNRAKSHDEVAMYADANDLFLLYSGEQAAAAICALELWEISKELPSLAVRMVVHTGLVVVGPENKISGAGIDVVRQMIGDEAATSIQFSQSYSDSLQRVEGWQGQILVDEKSRTPSFHANPQKVVFLDAGSTNVLDVLETALSSDGHATDDDRHDGQGVKWAKSVEARIRTADILVAIVSDEFAKNEVMKYLLEVAIDERQKRGKPQILPVWLNEEALPEGPLSALARNLYHASWHDDQDNGRMVSEVRAALAVGQSETEANSLDTPHVDDPVYIPRSADGVLGAALDRHESIVLVKGPRQIGKTHLMHHGLAHAAEKGWRCSTTDFQNLSSKQLEDEESCYRAVADTLGKSSGFVYDFDEEWLEILGPARNFDHFLVSLLQSSDEPLVWFIDEADRLFAAPFASEFYGLVRSWHNARAADPDGPWNRLTVVIGYATDAHLFIKDLNRSPFNVGFHVRLDMFSLADIKLLNELHGNPVENVGDLTELEQLIGGHPFLARRAFDILAQGKTSLRDLIAQADQENGPFGDHLKRILVSVTQLPDVWDALVQSLTSPLLADSNGLHRLLAAGILVQTATGRIHLRNDLYKRFLARYVAG